MQGKTIILGVCGGIAAYKAVELLRLYIKAGAKVHVIMTRAAQEFVTPLTLQTLSGNPVHTDLFNLYQEQEIGHISLADQADAFVVAPATANIVAKIAHGLADDLLTTSILATKAPVLLVPAMNVNMFENSLYERNENTLREHGYHILEPITGALACGWEGKGKLPDPGDIFHWSQNILAPQDMSACRILVTAGPTREEIDPVRYLTNYSSGKMGYAIAAAAQSRGAKVTLVSGPTALQPPQGVDVIQVNSALEMQEAVLANFSEADVVIKAAAVADYRPVSPAGQKMKKSGQDSITLQLEKNPDILADLGQKKGDKLLIGFAAETENLVENAEEKLRRKNLDLIVANDVTCEGAGFDVDTNLVRILAPGLKVEALEPMSKRLVAGKILDRVVDLLKKKS